MGVVGKTLNYDGERMKIRNEGILGSLIMNPALHPPLCHHGEYQSPHGVILNEMHSREMYVTRLTMLSC